MLLIAVHCLRLLTKQTVLAGQLAVALIFFFFQQEQDSAQFQKEKKKSTSLLGQMGLQEGWFSFHIYLLSAVKNNVLEE